MEVKVTDVCFPTITIAGIIREDYAYNEKDICTTSINVDTFEAFITEFGYCDDKEPCKREECTTLGGAQSG